ncbi:MAG: IS110 family transposase [Clostridiales bacterium]|nr:MAG: IS110 family transposase [Clostridiales bacterium]
MNSIVYVGMDVHKESYTLCCYTYERDKAEYIQKIPSDYRLILKYVNNMRSKYGEDAEFICGYEAGFLGYSLYHELMAHELKCIILAPTTMAITNKNKVKTDKRDAANIARCLAFRTYSQVYVPDQIDNEIKDYIRMRDDKKIMLKKVKQQILAYVLRTGKRFDEGKSYWTLIHLKWLKNLDLKGLAKETLEEYLITYEYLVDKIERLDERIEELSQAERYNEKVSKMQCLLGIKTHTALSIIVEVGDFERFEKASKFSAFLGLVPSESSSGDTINRFSITKAGNSHLRRLLVESAQAYTRGRIGHKSKALKARQRGNPSEIIAYADKANERLRRKFYKMTLSKGIKRNIATTAVARELSCFIWGMMTNNIA